MISGNAKYFGDDPGCGRNGDGLHLRPKNLRWPRRIRGLRSPSHDDADRQYSESAVQDNALRSIPPGSSPWISAQPAVRAAEGMQGSCRIYLRTVLPHRGTLAPSTPGGKVSIARPEGSWSRRRMGVSSMWL